MSSNKVANDVKKKKKINENNFFKMLFRNVWARLSCIWFEYVNIIWSIPKVNIIKQWNNKYVKKFSFFRRYSRKYFFCYVIATRLIFAWKQFLFYFLIHHCQVLNIKNRSLTNKHIFKFRDIESYYRQIYIYIQIRTYPNSFII